MTPASNPFKVCGAAGKESFLHYGNITILHHYTKWMSCNPGNQGCFILDLSFQSIRCTYQLKQASDLHLYFSWTSAMHKLTSPILKLRTRILPFRALQERNADRIRKKKLLRLQFLKGGQSQITALWIV